MIVSILVKGLLFYLLFVFFRSLLKGASVAKQVKEQFERQRDQYNEGSFSSQKRPQDFSKEDVVEAEFKRR